MARGDAHTHLSLLPTHSNRRISVQASYLSALNVLYKREIMSHCNPGCDYDETWFKDIHIDLAALNRRAATLKTKRCVKKAYQAAWLLRAATCIDLTTLAGDDTDTNVQRLCFKVDCH